ncbi:MAG: uS8 family ribosomal protein, partial [Planctomycetota bacterium]|jgi:small subunit ribosomal protein S8
VRINKGQVNVKASNICEGIATVLKQEGYVEDFDRIDDGKQGTLRITLKYDQNGRSIIDKITMAGMGIAIISTSKGVMSDRSCRQANVGGEILCTVS